MAHNSNSNSNPESERDSWVAIIEYIEEGKINKIYHKLGVIPLKSRPFIRESYSRVYSEDKIYFKRESELTFDDNYEIAQQQRRRLSLEFEYLEKGDESYTNPRTDCLDYQVTVVLEALDFNVDKYTKHLDDTSVPQTETEVLPQNPPVPDVLTLPKPTNQKTKKPSIKEKNTKIDMDIALNVYHDLKNGDIQEDIAKKYQFAESQFRMSKILKAILVRIEEEKKERKRLLEKNRVGDYRKDNNESGSKFPSVEEFIANLFLAKNKNRKK